MQYGKHLVSHIQHPKIDDPLHVIGVISNPARYHSRYRLFKEWYEAMEATPGVCLHVAEAAYGDREHEVVREDMPSTLKLRTKSEIWIKENLINLAARWCLPRDWKYLAWVDCDVFFRNPNWAIETVQELQHFPVVQPWGDCLDLGPQGNVMNHFKSFGFQHQRRAPKQKWPSQPYPYAHTGFAWACTRAFWEQVQGLLDIAILGSADHHQAFAMIGEVQDTVHKGMHVNFLEKCLEWQRLALRITHGEVGFVPGRIEHGFHGPKGRRYYRERWQILVDHQFDPVADLVRDPQGLLTLSGKPALEQAIRLYNRSRHEDSIEET